MLRFDLFSNLFVYDVEMRPLWPHLKWSKSVADAGFALGEGECVNSSLDHGSFKQLSPHQHMNSKGNKMKTMNIWEAV